MHPSILGKVNNNWWKQPYIYFSPALRSGKHSYGQIFQPKNTFSGLWCTQTFLSIELNSLPLITNLVHPLGWLRGTPTAETHWPLLYEHPNRNRFLRHSVRLQTRGLHEGISLHWLDREHRLALKPNNYVGKREFVRNVLFLELSKVQMLTI